MTNLPVTYKLKSFRVSRFRSIRDDTGHINVGGVRLVSSPLALIGVNESGKSNILKALSLLSTCDYNGDRDRPFHYRKEEIPDENFVWADFEYVTKDYGKGVVTWALDRDNESDFHCIPNKKTDQSEELESLLRDNKPNFILIEELSAFKDYVLLKSDNDDSDMGKARASMLRLLQVYQPRITLESISEMFSEDDSDDFQKGLEILEDLQKDLSDAIREIWGVKINVEITPNTEQLVIRVKDDRSENEDNDIRYSVMLSERSAGFRWLFAWAVAFVISQKEKRNTVFLFDEPAIHLHPTAQEKFRDKIIELCKDCAGVVYSTHLPYIVNIENIQNNYIVYREGAVSKVEKINATVAKEARLVLDRALGISNKDMLSLYAHRNCIIVGSEKARMLMHHIQSQRKKDFDFPEIVSIEGQRFMPSLAEIIQMERKTHEIEDKHTICLFEVDDDDTVEGYKKLLAESGAAKGVTLSEACNDERFCVIEDILPKNELSEFLQDEEVPKASQIKKDENQEKSITKILSKENLEKARRAVSVRKFKDMLLSAATNQTFAHLLEYIKGL